MMYKKLILVLFWPFIVPGVLPVYSQVQPTRQPVDYVDNRIGVLDAYSNCTIGPQLPAGSVNPSPQTKRGNDDGYHPDEPIRGFSQLTQSGTGWGTNGQIFISPQVGLAVEESAHDSRKSAENATAYEYSVTLDRYDIGVSVSPSYHSAIYQFRFPKTDSAHLLLDITHNIPMDIKPVIGGEVSAGEILVGEDHQSFSGYGTYRGGFGNGIYTIYYAAEISKAPTASGTWLNGKINKASHHQALINKNDRVGAFVNLSTTAGELVYMKVAISYKSVEQAKAWLSDEIPAWNYEKTRETARTTWNNALRKIEVAGGTEKDKSIFYTSLYHAHLMPRNRTNDTKLFGKNVPVWDDHFAVWDTWRTVFPLHVLINPAMVSGTINSFLARFKQHGMVKDAFVNGNDMLAEQGGNNIDNIIADAYVKKLPGVDWEKAYQLLKYNADSQRLGSYGWRPQDSLQNTYKKTGWIPAGMMNVSMSLEYSYNDYVTAQVARGLGKQQDYQRYLKRSRQWVNLWNKDATSDGFKGFVMPKTVDGRFVDIDLKAYPGSWKNYFYEGSAWNYAWFMPHQFADLVKLNGGNEKFVAKLDHGFKNRIINYGNEPAFLAAHQFIYAGRPDLTSYWVKQLMNKSFTLQGYPGNDDSGAMSSWYVFAAMGFFPNAGQPIYYLTGPLFKNITIHLANGKLLRISAPNTSEQNIYINSIYINGKKQESHIITHDQISNGGSIVFNMDSKPSLH